MRQRIKSKVEGQKKEKRFLISPFFFILYSLRSSTRISSPFMITLARVLTLRDRRKAYP